MKKFVILLMLSTLLLTACQLGKPEIVELRVRPLSFKLYSGEQASISFQAVYDDGEIIELTHEDITIEEPFDIEIKESGLKVGNLLEADMTHKVVFSYEDISANIELEVISNPLLNYSLNEEGKKIVKDTERIDVIVSKEFALTEDYEPISLVVPDISWPPNLGYNSGYLEKKHLRPEVAEAIEALFEAAERAGHKLYGVSGYRSYDLQKRIFANNVVRFGSEEEANRISARPGESEHHTGLVMDISSETIDKNRNGGSLLVRAFAETPEGKWVAENAADYGFIIRYQDGKEDIVGYTYEPWHLRYVGQELAKLLYQTNLTMEEYFSMLLE